MLKDKLIIVLLVLLFAFVDLAYQRTEQQEDVGTSQKAAHDEAIDGSKKKCWYDFLKKHECPNIQNVQKFDAEKFAGRWYETFKSRNMDDGLECTTKNYTLLSNDTFEMVSTSMQLQRRNREESERVKVKQHGKALIMKVHGGQGNFRLSNSKTDYGKENFRVISTDYKSYAIMYKCDNLLFKRIKKQQIWVYTRRQLNPVYNKLDEEEYQRIGILAQEFLENILQDFNFNEQMELTTQGDVQYSGCVYPRDLWEIKIIDFQIKIDFTYFWNYID